MQMSTAIETDNGEMIVKRVSVPIGLEELMEGLTKEVLLKKPKDIYVFASEYFARLLDLREKGSLKDISGKKVQSITKQIPRENGGRLLNRKSKSIEPVRQLSRQTSIRSESPMKKTLSAKKLTLVPKEERSEKTADKAKSFLDKRKARKGSKDSNNGKQSTDSTSDKSEKKTPRIRERSVSTGKQSKNEEDNIKMPRQRSQSIKSSARKSVQKTEDKTKSSKDSEVVGSILKQTPSLLSNKSETSDNTQSLSEEKDIDDDKAKSSARNEDVEIIQKTPSHEDKDEEVETCIGCSLKEEGAIDLITDNTEKQADDLQDKETEETTAESSKPDKVSNTKNDNAVLTQSVDKSMESEENLESSDGVKEAITGSIDEVDSGIDVDKATSKLRYEQSDEQSETSKTVSTLGTTENNMEKEQEVEAVGNIAKESSAERHILNAEKTETLAEASHENKTNKSDREDAKLSTDVDSTETIILPDSGKKEEPKTSLAQEEEKSVDAATDGIAATLIQPVEIGDTDKTVKTDVPDKESNNETSTLTEMQKIKKEETPIVESILGQKDDVKEINEELKTSEEENNKNQEKSILKGNNTNQSTSEKIIEEEGIFKKSSENSTEYMTDNEKDKKDKEQEENIDVIKEEKKPLEPINVPSDNNEKLTENIENNDKKHHAKVTPRQKMKAFSAEHAETQDKNNKVKRIKSVDLNKKNTLVHTRSKDKLFLNKSQDGIEGEVPKHVMDVNQKNKIRCKRAVSADVIKEKDAGQNINNVAHRISFDSSKLQDELKEASKISKGTTFKTSYNPYKLRQEIKEASQNRNNEESNKIVKTISDVAAAIKIQSIWRGFKVRRRKTSKTEKQQHAIDEGKSVEETAKQLTAAVNEGKDKSEIETLTSSSDNTDKRKQGEMKIEPDVIKETKLNQEMSPEKNKKSENDTNEKPSEISSVNQVNVDHKNTNNLNKNEEKPSKEEESPQQPTIKEDGKSLNEGKNKDKNVKDHAIADAVLKIQALWRGFKVRKHLKHAKLFGTTVEAQDKKQEIIEMSRKIDKAIAVSKIQAFWRGYKVRKNIKEVNKRLDALQKPGECDEMPNQRGPTDEDIFKAASKIQAGVRGYMIRKKRSGNHLNSIEEAPEEKLSDEQVIQAPEGLEKVPGGSPIRKHEETGTEGKNIEEINRTTENNSNKVKSTGDEEIFSDVRKLNISTLQKEIEQSDEKFKKMVASNSQDETSKTIHPEEASSIYDGTEDVKKLNVSNLQDEMEKSNEKFKEMVASGSREETTPKTHPEEDGSTKDINKSQLIEEPKTNHPKEISDSTIDQDAQAKIHNKEESLTENNSNKEKSVVDDDTLSDNTDKKEQDLIPNTENKDDHTSINKVSKTETIQSQEKENKEVKNESEFIPSELNSTTTNKLSDSDTFAISDDSISNNTVNKEEIGPVSLAASNEPSYEDAPTRPVTSDIMLENTNNQMISDKTEADRQNKQSDDSENIDTNSLKNVNEKDKNTINEENIKTLNKINNQLSQGQSVQDDKQELIRETCKQERLLSGDSSTSVDSAATVIFNNTSSRDDEKIKKEDEIEKGDEENAAIESSENQSEFNIQSVNKKDEEKENKDNTSYTKQKIPEDETLEKTDKNVITEDVIKSREDEKIYNTENPVKPIKLDQITKIPSNETNKENNSSETNPAIKNDKINTSSIEEKVIEKKNIAGTESHNITNQLKKSGELKTKSESVVEDTTKLDVKNEEILETEKSTKTNNESLTGVKEQLSTETKKKIEVTSSATEHTEQKPQTDVITEKEKKASEQKPLKQLSSLHESAANNKLEGEIVTETKNNKTETNVKYIKNTDEKSGSFDMSALRHEIALYGHPTENDESFATEEKAASERHGKEDIKKLNILTLQKEIEKSDEKFKEMVASSSRDETTPKTHSEEEGSSIDGGTEDVKKLNVSTLQNEIEKSNKKFKEMVTSGSCEETTPKKHQEEERSSKNDSNEDNKLNISQLNEEQKANLPKEISDSPTEKETVQANIHNTDGPLSTYIPLRSLSDIKEEDADVKPSECLENETQNVQNEQQEKEKPSEKVSIEAASKESSINLDALNTPPESGEVEKNLGTDEKENLSINSENGEIEQKGGKDSAKITVNLKTRASPETQEVAHEIKIGQQENVQIPAGATINLVHSGEFHDTVISVSPPQRASAEEDHQAQNRQTSPQGLVNTGELHDNVLPVSVHLNEAPPGVEVLTSLASKSINNDGQDWAQASNKDASTCEAQSDNTTSSSAGMDTEKRNNASIPKKSMEIEAATKIQAGFRGYQVRKQLKNKISAPGDISSQRRSARRKNSGRLTDSGRISKSKTSPSDIEEKSAVKIQAGVRGFLVRRRQKKQKQGKESA